jgi:hypothetical protein
MAEATTTTTTTPPPTTPAPTTNRQKDVEKDEPKLSWESLATAVGAVDLVLRYANRRTRATVLPMAIEAGLVPEAPPPPAAGGPSGKDLSEHEHTVAVNRLYSLLGSVPPLGQEAV